MMNDGAVNCHFQLFLTWTVSLMVSRASASTNSTAGHSFLYGATCNQVA